MHLPPGVAANLASITPCPEPQAKNDECSEESLVGHSTASAGLGTDPVSLGGNVYLTGPTEIPGKAGRSPFGLLAVTHAQAGPFYLGNIPVRSAIDINPVTAAVTVTSEPIPEFVKVSRRRSKRSTSPLTGRASSSTRPTARPSPSPAR